MKNRLAARHIDHAQIDEPVDVDAILQRPTGGPITNIKENRKRKKKVQLEKLLDKAHEITNHSSKDKKH